MVTFTVEYEREDDGRWLAEVIELPGVLAYGSNSDEAIAKAQALALRVLADRLEHDEGKSHELIDYRWDEVSRSSLGDRSTRTRSRGHTFQSWAPFV